MKYHLNKANGKTLCGLWAKNVKTSGFFEMDRSVRCDTCVKLKFAFWDDVKKTLRKSYKARA